jgi:hypothetical protein
MRLVHTLFFIALASMAGCGGCDACGGTSGNDSKPSSTAPQETVAPIVETPDAAVLARDLSEAGHDAAPAASSAPVVPLAVSAPPRPHGPMPMGGYQSCGVYDGPLCTKDCPKGNCRQECDGTDCVLSCAGGYCSQLCGASATCRLTCNGGHCIQVCSAPGCVKTCSGGSCE